MKADKKAILNEFNKNEIICAAEKVFAEKTFFGSTVDDIAREAGYSKSTLYVYFDSKDEVYNHIIYKAMAKMLDMLKIAIDTEDAFQERYYRICWTLVDFQENFPLYYESVSGNISIDFEESNTDSIIKDIYYKGEELNAVIAAFIEEGRQQGVLHEDIKSWETAFTQWGSITGVIKLAGQKSAYIQKECGCKLELLKKSFVLLFESIRRKK